jgi:hypothetical protein
MSMLLFLLMMTMMMMMMMTTVTIIAKRSFIMIGKDQSCSVYTFITIMYRFLLASLILIRFFLPPTFSVSTRYFPSRKPWLSKSRPAAQERPFLWSQNGALHIAYLHGFIYVYTPMSLYVQRSQIYLLYTVYIYIYHSTFILIYTISYQYYIINISNINRWYVTNSLPGSPASAWWPSRAQNHPRSVCHPLARW